VIFVVQDGSIVEKGKHEQLLAHGGLYSELYELQFDGQVNFPASAQPR
jgi:ATP-binding cassette subfamily B protein